MQFGMKLNIKFKKKLKNLEKKAKNLLQLQKKYDIIDYVGLRDVIPEVK